jgi:phosphoserine phosphatase RsbU/P
MADKKTIDIARLELQSLLEVTQAINQNLPEKDLYKIFRFTLLANLSIEKICLYAANSEGNFENKISYGTDKTPDPAAVSPYLNLTKISAFDSREESDFQYIIPVLHKKKMLAIIFLKLSDGNGQNALDEVIRFVQLLANVLMVAIENKNLVRQEMVREARRESLRKELDIARAVQRNLFPKSLPKEGIFTCASKYLPHEQVGGDYYDYMATDNGKYLFCIADVSGKGIPAALLMSNFQASLRALVDRASDLKDLVQELNHLLKVNANSEHFITVFIGLYDPARQLLQYINAGHNPPVYVDTEGKVRLLEAGTTILGFFDPLPFIEMGQIENIKEGLIFTYTDGLVETMSPSDEQYGITRLQEFLSAHHQMPLDQLQDALLAEIESFKAAGPYADDLTLLCCRIQL